MKKIKLLTPLLTITTLSSVLPIVSCKSDQKEQGDTKSVTKAEWQTALDKLWDVENERNFSSNIKVKYTFTEDIENQYLMLGLDWTSVGFDNGLKLKTGVKLPGREETVVPLENYWTIYEQDKDLNWLLKEKSEDETSYTIFPMSEDLFKNKVGYKSNFIAYWMFLGILYDWYDVSKYDAAAKIYSFTFVDYETLKVDLKIKFNDDKNISNIDGDLYMKLPTEEIINVKVESTFDNYGTSVIQDKPSQEKIDEAKSRMFTNVELNSAQVTATIPSWIENDFIYLNLTPNAQAGSFEYNKIYFTRKIVTNSNKYAIYINDKKIDHNYFQLWSEGSEEGGCYFLLTNGLKITNNDNVTVVGVPNDTYENVTVTISKKA